MIAKEKTKRQKLIAKIHIGKKYLGLNEDDYIVFLKSSTGKESTRDMNIEELKEVLNSMNVAGFNSSTYESNKYFYASGYDRRYLSERQVKYIKGLWWQNANYPSEETLKMFIKRMTGKNSLGECRQKEANILITAIQEMKK
ncbi:regulatory protein GemA [uncultured Brachyspira sp.]|uniref:phage protein GemA/Gp16 family protein n=1 Tax=uncultured Brachyspira sp. TaxID=221953 RepID=UPI002587B301|nr:regulatory protein GemA [uncultured Brachyspira sp.]